MKDSDIIIPMLPDALCISASQAREIAMSKNTEICQALLCRIDERIRECAEDGGNNICISLFDYECDQVSYLCQAYLEELGYSVSFFDNTVGIEW